MSLAQPPFLAASASHETWQQAAAAILQQIGSPAAAHRLGLLYVSSHFANQLSDIEIFLRQTTGVPHWAGTTGHGVIGPDEEHFDQPSIAIMLMPLPEGSFHILSGIHEDTDPAISAAAGWLQNVDVPLILCHGDPSNNVLPGLLEDLALETSGFLVGGLSATLGAGSQLAGQLDGTGISGIMFSDRLVPVATGLTQGCSPIGEIHQVTEAIENVAISLDGRPALEIFKEDIGDLLAHNLERVNGYIYAALPLTGGDKPDYMVRNITGIDRKNGVLAIASNLTPGDSLLFCRRDHDSATEDMERLLRDLKSRCGDKPIRAGIYVSCAGRGPQQFGPGSVELKFIRETLGEFPLVGFFANGEISRDKLYGYTGVLTLFL